MRRATTLTLLIALTALAGCGGESHLRVDPEAMLDSAAAHPIRSADVDLDIRLQVEGRSRFSGPLRLRLEGPYAAAPSGVPRFDWRLSASALGFPVGGRLVSTGGDAYLSVYGDDYEVGPAAVASANARLRALGPFRPGAWLRRARDVGEGNEGGVDCERISAPLRAAAVRRYLVPLAEMLGLARPLGVSGTVGSCIGFEDRVIHELEMDARIAIPPADRPALGGATGAQLSVDLVASDVGRPQRIAAPSGQFRPITDLLLTLNDLGLRLPLG